VTDLGMSFETWLLFVVTEAVICFTPGPEVLLVLSLSLTSGADAGLRGAFGILAGNALYFVISATSLGALLLASWELFTGWSSGSDGIWSTVTKIAAGCASLNTSKPSG
jgi:threonine/homoserine/homoserine lactone efflux protein